MLAPKVYVRNIQKELAHLFFFTYIRLLRNKKRKGKLIPFLY